MQNITYICSKHYDDIIKYLFIFIVVLSTGHSAHARQLLTAAELPIIRLNSSLTVHFVSPENIQYGDISSHAITGDLPLKNVFRIRLNPDSVKTYQGPAAALGVLTIIGESFIAQYRLAYDPVSPVFELPTKIDILPEHTRPLDVPGMPLTSQQMKKYAIKILNNRTGTTITKARNYGISAALNSLYTIGEYVFMDITFSNDTNLSYQIDELRFKVEDRRIGKATNVQSVEVMPFWQLYPLGTFKKTFRNVYVLKKLTFPQDKLLNIELTEKQLSGRNLCLSIRYGDLLGADTF